MVSFVVFIIAVMFYICFLCVFCSIVCIKFSEGLGYALTVLTSISLLILVLRLLEGV